MPIQTKLTKLLGIEVPIVCGGMHHVGFAPLAAAVSNAGGLGIITALTQPTPEKLREEIRLCRSLTSKPFGVNMTLLPALKPPNYEAYINVIIEEGVKIVETAGRSPDKLIPLLKKHNIIVIHKCVAVKHAVSAQRYGADCISIDGIDCGGHPGEQSVSNWILLAQCKEQLTIPYIVSGGCANGTQLAAAIAFGAEGMNCGTRFMATKEANIKDGIKQALVEGGVDSTMLILKTLKNTERVYANDAAKKVAAIEAEKPGDINSILPYIKGENYRKSFQETGNPNDSVWSCGLSIALIHDIPSCEELLTQMVKDCEDSLQAAHKCVVQPAIAKL